MSVVTFTLRMRFSCGTHRQHPSGRMLITHLPAYTLDQGRLDPAPPVPVSYTVGFISCAVPVGQIVPDQGRLGSAVISIAPIRLAASVKCCTSSGKSGRSRMERSR